MFHMNTYLNSGNQTARTSVHIVDTWYRSCTQYHSQHLSASAQRSVPLNRKQQSWVRIDRACVSESASRASTLFTCWQHMTLTVSSPPSQQRPHSLTGYRLHQWTDCWICRETTGLWSWVIGWWEDDSGMLGSGVSRTCCLGVVGIITFLVPCYNVLLVKGGEHDEGSLFPP